MDNVIYVEVQRFYENKIMAAAAPVLIIVFIASAIYGLIQDPSLLKILLSVAYLVTAFLVFFICFYMRLETTITSYGIKVRFFPFITRTIPFSVIKRGRIRTYKPLKEFGGWGIRSGKGDKCAALNVSGDTGLELYLDDGKKVLIGTRNPKTLASSLIDKIPLVIS